MSAVVDPVVPSSEGDAPPPPLVFTDSAANKVKELVDEEGNPDLKLRVFVQGGGASPSGDGTTGSTTALMPRSWKKDLPNYRRRVVPAPSQGQPVRAVRPRKGKTRCEASRRERRAPRISAC